MAVKTSATTTLHISASQPAAYDAAGYALLVWTAVGEVTDLGEFGREFALISHNPLGSRGTVKKKGSFNEGSISLQLGLDTDDAGQILMKAASLSDNDYSFKVTTQNGDKYNMQAQVMSWKVGIGSVDQITAATASLEITSTSAGVGIVESLAA